jgi:hypothetical protein
MKVIIMLFSSLENLFKVVYGGDQEGIKGERSKDSIYYTISLLYWKAIYLHHN